MSDGTEAAADQHLIFTLGEKQYAVEVSRAMGVLEYTTITKVPRTLEFMRGVINVRGSVIPAVDLRLKFEMSATEKTIDTSIIDKVFSGKEIAAVTSRLATESQTACR